MQNTEMLREAIRDIPDFPKPGIIFKDITPVLKDPALFRTAVDIYEQQVRGTGATKIAAVDARGFLFAGAVADRLKIGVVPIRKKGKLPYRTFEQTYDLEYGTATLTVHEDAFVPGEKVALIDDLLATGGTAKAAAQLIERGRASVVKIAFLIELAFLKGRSQLAGYDVYAAIVF
ncbi:MAG: adenine phosphoribosyltransferase [Kiritimatiellae bacterium]|nr:adenine phosphoribosyltransferase [Kiritimatiellia bacterium]